MVLYLNGAVYLKTRDKNDRKIATATTIEVLRKGGNLCIYLDGAWNIEPSNPIMQLFQGIVRMAQKIGCEIVPVSIEVYDNRYIVNIGNNLN